MVEEKREAGRIEVGEGLFERLSLFRRVEDVRTPAELEVEAVRDVERGLGWRLPNDMLGIFAAHVPFLEDSLEMSLSKVIGHTGKVRALGATGDLVGIGKEGRARFLCLEKKGETTAEPRLTIFDTDDRKMSRSPLLEWLDGIIEQRASLMGIPPAEPATSSTPGSFGDKREFEPTLVRRLPTGSPGQEVMHPTFGVGRVLLEKGAGPNRKVKVDFPGKGLKLIQARFLRWLE